MELRCAALRCAALRCAALCCAVLCCAVLCCAVLCCAVLCCAVLCCAVLCCAVLCCAVLLRLHGVGSHLISLHDGTTHVKVQMSVTILNLIRLLDTAKRQKLRSNSGLSQRELLDSGIDIMETNGELYSDAKEQASRRNVEAQLYAAGLSFSFLHAPSPPPPPCCLIAPQELGVPI